jgi:gas vesicle structural protein
MTAPHTSRDDAPADDLHDRSDEHMSLCEAVDRLLHKGVVLRGEITISVADIELVYLGLQVLLASADTARQFIDHAAQPRRAAIDLRATASAHAATTIEPNP